MLPPIPGPNLLPHNLPQHPNLPLNPLPRMLQRGRVNPIILLLLLSNRLHPVLLILLLPLFFVLDLFLLVQLVHDHALDLLGHSKGY